MMALIAGFGVLGVLARYGADLLFVARMGSAFPYGTLAVNLAGCLAAGAVYSLGSEKQVFSEAIRQALLIGFCGGFTTFSAYGLQIFLLLESGAFVPGIAYFLLSPVLGLAAVYLGISAVRFFG